jgi:hypothetical protein
MQGQRHDPGIGIDGDLARAQVTWPGWAERLITHRVAGLDRFDELLDLLRHGRDVIKVVCDVGALA